MGKCLHKTTQGKKGLNMYSQGIEELYLLDYFKDINNGVLVDIGAADGINNSNSRKLLELGWSGLLVEPNKKNYNKLKDLYTSNENIILENVGCSLKTELNQVFYIDQNDQYEQLSTFSYDQSVKCKNIFNCGFIEDTIDVYHTTELLLKHNITNIKFLTIDTEAFDSNVIRGIDFNKIEIELICIENIDENAMEILKTNNYEICFKTDNTFFKKNK
jgi:FkbM family methyltransferase